MIYFDCFSSKVNFLCSGQIAIIVATFEGILPHEDYIADELYSDHRAQIFQKGWCKLLSISFNWVARKDVGLICCQFQWKFLMCFDFLQNDDILILFEYIEGKRLEKIKNHYRSQVDRGNSMEFSDLMASKTHHPLGLGFRSLITSKPQNDKCSHFEKSPNINKLPTGDLQHSSPI